MKIKTFGARFYGGQIDRIDKGFIELGYEVNNFDGLSDLIYCNDMSNYQQAYENYILHSNKCKFILNVLDCPTFVSEWPKIKLEWLPKLLSADKVTCISKAVQNDLKAHFDVNAEVIYNPIKNVYFMPEYKENKDILALFVGRALAPNKRVKEIIWPLYNLWINKMQVKPDFLHFVGSENTGFGVNHGIVSDEELNILYNRSIFTLIPSKQEGLNLPLIESLCTDSIPIVCNDMSTAGEFCPPELMCEPDYISMTKKIWIDGSSIDFYKICESYRNKYREQFSPQQVVKNILQVYNSIV